MSLVETFRANVAQANPQRTSAASAGSGGAGAQVLSGVPSWLGVGGSSQPSGMGVGGGNLIAQAQQAARQQAQQAQSSGGARMVTYDRSREQVAREMDQVAGMLGSRYAMDFNAHDDRMAQLRNSLAAQDAGYAQQRDALNRQLANQQRGAELDMRAADIQLGNMLRWHKYLIDNRDLSYRGIDQSLAALHRTAELSRQNRDMGLGEIEDARGVLHRTADLNRRDALSDATVRGVIGSVGRDWETIEAARGEGEQDLSRQTDRVQHRFRSEEEERRQSRDALLSDRERVNLSYREQKDRLVERQQLLEVEAERARLSQRQMQDAMDVALAQLNLSQVMSQGQFLEAMANANAQQNALIGQFLRDLDAWLSGINRGQGTVQHNVPNWVTTSGPRPQQRHAPSLSSLLNPPSRRRTVGGTF